MKNITRIFVLTIFCISTLSLISCAKKKGCMIQDATNYDADAVKSDESCEFKANILIWINKSTSDSLVSHSINNMKVYINNTYINQFNSLKYFNESPYCTDTATFTTQQTWTGTIEKDFSYRITDLQENTLWSGNFPVKANYCNSMKLIWQ